MVRFGLKSLRPQNDFRTSARQQYTSALLQNSGKRPFRIQIEILQPWYVKSCDREKARKWGDSSRTGPWEGPNVLYSSSPFHIPSCRFHNPFPKYQRRWNAIQWTRLNASIKAFRQAPAYPAIRIHKAHIICSVLFFLSFPCKLLFCQHWGLKGELNPSLSLQLFPYLLY